MIARGVAAVIPAYQAAASVAAVAQGAARHVEHVLVVDDGSDDGTAEAARAAGAEVLTHARNRGKGAALRSAFDVLFARNFTWVASLDADGQHLPDELPKLLDARNDAELVLGVRTSAFMQMARVRRIANRTSSRLISFVAGQRLSDVQSGFRLYSRALIEAIEFDETGFEAESAIVVRAARRGFRVAMTPIELGFADGRCTSHYRPLRDSLRIAHAVARARLEPGARGE